MPHCTTDRLTNSITVTRALGRLVSLRKGHWVTGRQDRKTDTRQYTGTSRDTHGYLLLLAVPSARWLREGASGFRDRQ